MARAIPRHATYIDWVACPEEGKGKEVVRILWYNKQAMEQNCYVWLYVEFRLDEILSVSGVLFSIDLRASVSDLLLKRCSFGDRLWFMSPIPSSMKKLCCKVFHRIFWYRHVHFRTYIYITSSQLCLVQQPFGYLQYIPDNIIKLYNMVLMWRAWPRNKQGVYPRVKKPSATLQASLRFL